MNKKNYTIVIGLGKTGLSCIQYLYRQGDRLTVYDTRIKPPNLEQFQQKFPDIELILDDLNPEKLAQADRIVVSPGLSIHNSVFDMARKNNVPIIGDVELFAQAITAPVVAITGTNGKSTVATLLGDMAKAAGINVVVAGNIGTPVCDLLNQPEAELYVLELSSFQLAATYSLKPKVATILNITPDHLDWHTDLQDYITAKQRIYTHAEYCIINRDDANTYTTQADYTVGLSKPVSDTEFGFAEGWLMQGDKRLFAIEKLQIVGKHNQRNALTALALGTAINLPLAVMQQALSEFSGLAHRCQFVAELKNVKWYNDSKATNVAAAISAIEGLAPSIAGKIVLIAGGDAKGAELTDMTPCVKQHVTTAIVYGKDKQQFVDVLGDVATVELTTDLSQAVLQAYQHAQSGDAVLLAPACSSLDMFKDYQHRGAQFVELVKKLCQNN